MKGRVPRNGGLGGGLRQDIIVVIPCEKIPLDGKILDGVSILDTRALTDESMPRMSSPGLM